MNEAVKTYEKVVTDNPLYAPATRQLALLYSQRSSDNPKAYELARRPAKPIQTIRKSPKRLAFSTIGAGTTRSLQSC